MIRHRGNREAGETLLESVVTVAILGISMVAILAGIWTTLRVSDFNAKTSDADTVLRGFAEAMKQPDPTSTFKYVPCTAEGAEVTYPEYEVPSRYDRYDAEITNVRYLTGYSGDQLQWSETCPASDQGLQEITLSVTGPLDDPAVQGTETVTVLKRDARADLPRGSA